MRPDKSDLWTILVFSVVVGILTLTTPIAVEALVNTVAFGRFVQPVVILSLIVLVFLAFSSALSTVTIYVAEIIQRRLFVRVAEDIAYRIPRVEQTGVDGQHVPELLNRFFDVVTVQKSLTKLLLDGIAIVLQTVIGMAVLAFYHPFLLGFDIVLLMLIAFTLFVLGRGAVNTAIGESIAKYNVAAWLQELGRHPHAFKLHQGATLANDRADQLVINWLDARRVHFRVVMRQVIFAFIIYCVATTTLLGLGGWLVIAGQLSLGQLVAAELIVILIVRSFTKLGKHMESIYDMLAAVDKLGVVLDLPVESHDRFTEVDPNSAPDLHFDHVGLTVGHRNVFHDFELHIPAGKSIGFIGLSDAGKSYLMELCCGIRHPEHGHILWNGVDLREIRVDSLRAAIGVAGEPQIFEGTVDENIRLNRSNLESSWLRKMIPAIGLGDVISQLPLGIHTSVQTHGFPLSINQARLVTLARALASRPALLIIDGLLDHLPVERAQEILSFIDQALTSTVIVLTVRPEIAQLCQQQPNLGKTDN
jgi:ABC-type bacteriocin/lantibiotic exporter with double-glycine peptidase domain